MKNLFKTLLPLIIVTLFILNACSPEKEKYKIVETILEDTSSYFYVDLNDYRNKDAKLPIGIFDSGTGGLTVFDAIVNFDKYNNSDHNYLDKGDSIRDFNQECFIYLADQANMPYGNYSAHGKSDLLKEHVLKDVQFLLGSKYYQRTDDINYHENKSFVKALVIACNTATAYAKEDIERFINKAELDIKVIGVIGAGVRAALENLNSEEESSIAILATAGTVSSNGYIHELEKQLINKKYKDKINIFQQAGVGLAGAIDEAIEYIDRDAVSPRKIYKGPSDQHEKYKIYTDKLSRYNFDWSKNNMLYEGNIENPSNIQINSVENYIAYHTTTLLEQIISQDNPSPLKVIILGCTHYPFYTDVFREKLEELRELKENGDYIYKNIIAEKVEYIDPAIFTAKELYEHLNDEKLFNDGDINNSEFYISVPNLDNPNILVDENGNFTYDYKYGRKENEIQQYVKRVPFSRRNISDDIALRLSDKIPFTYGLIKSFNSDNLKTGFLSQDERLK